MHTKFRPIVTENARKTNLAVSEPTETALAKVVKPIAISGWAKQESTIPPLSNNGAENNRVPLLRSIPVVDGFSNSLDEQHFEISEGEQHDSLHTQTSAPVQTVLSIDAFMTAKRTKTLGHVVAAEHLSISQSNQESDDAKDPNDYLHDVREGRPDSESSQEQVSVRSTQQVSLTMPAKQFHVAFPSKCSDPSSNESENRNDFVKADESEERTARDSQLELRWETTTHPRANNDFVHNLSISNGSPGNEFQNSFDNSTSSDPSSVKKIASHELPRTSEVLGSEDSSRSDSREVVHNGITSQESFPPPSSVASTGEFCDKVEVSSEMRKTSSGNRISLRRMELEKKSAGGSGDSNENPWFQNTSASKDEDKDKETSSLEKEAPRPAKEKKKKMNRFTRLFRTVKSGETDDKDDSMGSSSDELSLRASISDGSSAPAEDMKPNRDASEEHFEATLSLAISGKRNLEEVIDALLGLSGRPRDKVMKLLTKYMCSTVVIDAAFMIILEHEHAKKADIPMRSMAPSHARYSPHREALIKLFANGPRRLKKALLNHNKAKSEILRFFTEDRPDGYGEIPYWISTATCLSKILNGLLEQFPGELSEYIGGKKGVLHLMIKNHVHVPEVVEFVFQLSAANALSRTTGEDLRYGPANATGLVLLVKEGVCDLLVDIFKKSSIATAQGDAHVLEWQTQVMSSHCLLELSKRAVVIPRFTKDNCPYSGRYIKTLNSSLDDLSLFVNDGRVLSLLNAGFDAVSDGPEIESIREQSERNNPLVCALEVITELLETVRVASDSKLAVTRKTVGSISTKNIENHLISKMARLCKLLHRKSAHEVSCRAKVAIVNMFRCLCSSKFECTRLSMVKSQIPDRLMVLIRENEKSSVLHSCVLKCLSASFDSAHSIELQKEWLRALARSDGWLQVMYEYFHKVKEGERHGYKPYFNTFVAIGFRLIDFCQDDKASKLQPMLKSKAEQQTYIDSIETGLIRMRKEYETPCGGPKPSERVVSVLANAETLAARLHDFNAV